MAQKTTAKKPSLEPVGRVEAEVRRFIRQMQKRCYGDTRVPWQVAFTGYQKEWGDSKFARVLHAMITQAADAFLKLGESARARGYRRREAASKRGD